MDTRSPRRIVPPSLPAAAPGGAPSTYAPPKYEDPSAGNWTKVIILGAASFIAVAGGLLALQTWTSPPDPAILAATESRTTDPQGPQQELDKDATAAGWVGSLDLPIERATVAISTMPDDGKTASEWNENLGEAVSVAVLSIDNSSGAGEIVVDTSQAALKLADGKDAPALEPLKVLQSAKLNRDQILADQSPPFRCPVGQQMSGKAIFLPRGIDPHTITAVALTINGQKREVLGTFMGSAQKSAALRNKAHRPAAFGADATIK